LVEVTIFDANLLPFLTAVGWLVGHRFDDGDGIAVGEGIRHTDAAGGRWYDFEFYGGRRTPFSVAYDEGGSGVVLFRSDLPEEAESRVRLLGDFCCNFHWLAPAR
jgi:hypothetical protein